MFSQDEAGEARAGLAPLLLPAAALCVALLAGYATARMGAIAGHRAIYYLAVLGVLLAGGGIALTRAQPLRFAFLSLLAVLPVAAVPLPPARLGLAVFDAVALLLATGLLLHKAFAARGTTAPLFPAPSLALIWVLLLPCALLAPHPVRASFMLMLIFAAYIFFWLAMQELRRPGGLERVAGVLAAVLIVLSAALFLDGFLHVNLSMMGSNPNQHVWSGGGWIWRAGGMFQDPQRAAAFLVSLLSFLLVLAVRRRFNGLLRLLVWTAILIAAPALFLTVSRSAIVGFLLVSGATLVAFNRWHVALRLTACMVLLAGVLLTSTQLSTLLPASVAARLADSGEGWQTRKDIWFDTWEMFATRPLTGVGPGGFQRYLLDTRPGQTSYYGIGEDTAAGYVPDQPESGWFKVLYETGILGSAALLLLVGATLRRALGGIARAAADSHTRTELMAALAGLATFAITFTTLFTTADRRLLMLFALLLAVVWRFGPEAAPAVERSR